MTKPYYVPTGDEIRLFTEAFRARLPVLLKGPTGCGKTRFVEYMAWHLAQESPGKDHRPTFLTTVACHEDMTSSDLAGHFTFDMKQGAVWIDGPLTRAARHGGICYLDEIAEARPDVTVLIHPLTDHRRILPLPQKGEELDAHPAFMLVMSFNPGYQNVLKELKPSTRQRFVTLAFGYPSPSIEAKIVEAESGVDTRTALGLVAAAAKIRNLKDHGLTEGISTRLLVHAGRLIAAGVPRVAAVESAIVAPLTDDPDVAQSVREVLAAVGISMLHAAA